MPATKRNHRPVRDSDGSAVIARTLVPHAYGREAEMPELHAVATGLRRQQFVGH